MGPLVVDVEINVSSFAWLIDVEEFFTDGKLPEVEFKKSTLLYSL